MRHLVDPAQPDCDACTDDVDEIIFNKLHQVTDPSLITDLWDFTDELIDSDYNRPEEIVCWRRPIATHKLSGQTIFNTYTRELALEWELQTWDDWVFDPWEDMRDVLRVITADSRFETSGATVQNMASQIHAGHCRFTFCAGAFDNCEKCKSIAAEFSTT